MNDSSISGFSEDSQANKGIDKAIFFLSAGFLSLFIVLALVNRELLTNMVNQGGAWSIKLFGAYWQVLLLATFLIGLCIAIGRVGAVRLGNMPRPEINTFRWLSIIACTLLAGGGVFWAAAEPLSHYKWVPPLFGETELLFEKSTNALTQSFMHWSFLSWAILGSLTTIVFMRLHYDKGLPLQPRTLLYPVFGDRAINTHLGTFVDSCSIVAVAAGTIGPIGFLGLQVSYSLNKLFNLPDVFGTQLAIVLIAVVIYTISALSGLNKGIQLLSRMNVILATVLMFFILLFGPTGFIVDSYIHAVGGLIDKFLPMATYRADSSWLGLWTVFFWGWFMGYGPIMAIFIARISRGRTIRQVIISLSVIMPLITCFWFSIVGGAGLGIEVANPGSVVDVAFADGFNLPASLLAITMQLPMPLVLSVLFLILTTIFIVTTGDSMTYAISVVTSNSTSPNKYIRAIWGILMGAASMILISIGSGGISTLQYFIVITAVPVSLLVLPSLWNAPGIARDMAVEQGLINKK